MDQFGVEPVLRQAGPFGETPGTLPLGLGDSDLRGKLFCLCVIFQFLADKRAGGLNNDPAPTKFGRVEIPKVEPP